MLAVLAAFAPMSAASGAPAAATRPVRPSVTCDGTFHVVPTPKIKNHQYWFSGTTAISATDAWAVGVDDSFVSPSVRPGLAEHWDGTAWTKVQVTPPSDDSGAIYDEFTAVDAVSSTDVWAVGTYHAMADEYPHVLIEHWNGTKWTAFTHPEPTGTAAVATAVTAISAGDVWLVGIKNPGTYTQRTLTEHWNGSRWSVVKSPNKIVDGGIGDQLQAVSGTSSKDVWAVGGYGTDTGFKPFVLRWDGSAWNKVKSAGVSWGGLSGVAAVTPTFALAIGITTDQPNGAMSERWNGSSWKIKSVPPADDTVNLSPGQSGIAAASESDAWLVGNGMQFLIADHWDGGSWSQFQVETPLDAYSQLRSASVLPDGSQVFAAGATQPNQSGILQTLTEIFC